MSAKWATCSGDAALQMLFCKRCNGLLPAPCMTSSQLHERVHTSDDGLAWHLRSIGLFAMPMLYYAKMPKQGVIPKCNSCIEAKPRAAALPASVSGPRAGLPMLSARMPLLQLAVAAWRLPAHPVCWCQMFLYHTDQMFHPDMTRLDDLPESLLWLGSRGGRGI